MKPLISVIIPVYNVEQYLDKCILSVLNQTFNSFEVILVDNASTDRSGGMCDEYAKKYFNVRVIHNEENKGQAYSLNVGIDSAGADLVSFVDSDDFVSPDCLEYLFDLFSRYDVDIACASRKAVFNHNDYGLSDLKNNINEKVLPREEALKLIFTVSIGHWARLYKKELLVKNPFPVDHSYVDFANVPQIVSSCNAMAYGEKIVYYYYQRPGSVLNSVLSPERFYDILSLCDYQLKFVRENYPDVWKAALKFCCAKFDYLAFKSFAMRSKESKSYFHIVRDYIKSIKKDIFQNSYIPLKSKIACRSILAGYYPAKIRLYSKDILKRLIRK